MQVNLKNGIDSLIFGMKEADVMAKYGKPDLSFLDDDQNRIYLYNQYKIRLTFYEEEDYKLGYLVASSQDLTLFGEKIMGRKISDVKKILASKKINHFAEEQVDSFHNFFNEDNWLLFQVEFDEVVKLELGAMIKNENEFDWKFKG
ncbi:hypothetical protein B0A58_06415 [Flavobacterium branchiophilum NBRC 15030 = ATCC 35035]|uniref:Uncharacterized protein n=1 Tax=Flavobacterium branchiophilum TaxID=55197 RepID=A0A543G843_9FLAO|nr:hypothetical protein [Flavobacterium branchiophilum]OXA76887.1 hypothetical protein B0A58_06415 [Flavobacterium branchiophilum NBRC 15030 = ATCC 35035]TQM42252.1 hypothetical protein BC670_3296 [Flavobacterium branchiophilum]GEM54294.1 hypothetical protein FB1_05150 [Flavobacterium branchiophilum NBRC 15030 = ATCC 35035]